MGNINSKEDFVFNKAELKILLKNFTQLDINHSGYIEPHELFDVPELSDNPWVSRILNVFDENNDGCLSFYEFVNGLTSLAGKTDITEKYKLVFKIYDCNGDGLISNGDLYEIIHLWVRDTIPPVCIQQLVDRTMLYADKDKDGVWTFDEFVLFVETANIEQLFTMDILNSLHEGD